MAAGEARAAAAPLRPVVLPAPLEERIVASIEAQWETTLDAVVLEWGWPAEDRRSRLEAGTATRLVGNGDDGWFAVVFENPGEPGFAARLRVGVRVRMPVAVRDLTTGTRVRKRDVQWMDAVRWGRPSPTAEMPVPVGAPVRCDVSRGERLIPPVVVADPAVREGSRVRLIWKRGVVTVSLQGRALHDAAIGYPVEVQLRGDRGRARGTVLAEGLCRLWTR